MKKMTKDIKKALLIKVQKSAKKPCFVQRNTKKKKLARVHAVWKRPRGLHNKLRRRRRGIGAWVQTGYKMPIAVRGLDKQGLLPIVVATLEELKDLDAQSHVVIIGASVGKKKKVTILKESIVMKLSVANVKDPQAYIQRIEEEFVKKKAEKKDVAKQKEETKKAVQKKVADKAKNEEEKEEEKTIEDLAEENKEKKKEFDKTLEKKKELDKILTKKE